MKYRQDTKDINPRGGVDGFLSPSHQPAPKLILRTSPFRPASTYLRPKARRYRSLFNLTLAVALLYFALGGLLVFRWQLTAKRIFIGGGHSLVLASGEQVNPADLNQEGDGRINILLVGKGGPGHPGGDLTDSLMIASFDPLNQEASLLSIPRDLYILDPTIKQPKKINEVYFLAKQAAWRQDQDWTKANQAGMDRLAQTLELYLDIPVHFWVLADFSGFVWLVDEVGGVVVQLEKPISDEYAKLWLPAGWQRLDGQTALALARARHSLPTGDHGRTAAQRALLIALRNQAADGNLLSDINWAGALFESASEYVRTNLSLSQALSLIDKGRELPAQEIESIDITSLVVSKIINGQSVVVPKAGTNEWAPIQAFVRTKLVDGFLKKEGAVVMVVDASDRQIGESYRQELASYGYLVAPLAKAQTKPGAVELIVNNQEAVYTLQYLEQRYGLEGQTNASYQDLAADFVIILGSDAAVRQ